jgi:hypothetical protein
MRLSTKDKLHYYGTLLLKYLKKNMTFAASLTEIPDSGISENE